MDKWYGEFTPHLDQLKIGVIPLYISEQNGALDKGVYIKQNPQDETAFIIHSPEKSGYPEISEFDVVPESPEAYWKLAATHRVANALQLYANSNIYYPPAFVSPKIQIERALQQNINDASKELKPIHHRINKAIYKPVNTSRTYVERANAHFDLKDTRRFFYGCTLFIPPESIQSQRNVRPAEGYDSKVIAELDSTNRNNRIEIDTALCLLETATTLFQQRDETHSYAIPALRLPDNMGIAWYRNLASFEIKERIGNTELRQFLSYLDGVSLFGNDLK